jgi:hypothetical protein
VLGLLKIKVVLLKKSDRGKIGLTKIYGHYNRRQEFFLMNKRKKK